MQDSHRERAFKALLVQNVSTSWYLNELRRVLSRIEEIESTGDEADDKTKIEYAKLHGQLMYLCGKAFFERRLLKKLRKDLLNHQ